MHRYGIVLVGLATSVLGGLVIALAVGATFGRLSLLGGIGAVVGLLLVAFGVRARGDRLVLHEHGLVRHSQSLGTKSVRFDAITKLQQRPPAPRALGAIEITAGETFVVIDRSLVADLESFAATLESRSGQRVA